MSSFNKDKTTIDCGDNSKIEITPTQINLITPLLLENGNQIIGEKGEKGDTGPQGPQGLPGDSLYDFVEKQDFSSSVTFNNLNGDNERYLLYIQINAVATQGQYVQILPNGQGAWSGVSYSFTGNGDFGISERGSGFLPLAKVPNNTNNISLAGFLMIDFRANIPFRNGVGQFVATGGAGTGGFTCGLNGYGISGMTSLQVAGGSSVNGSIELFKRG